MEIVKGTKKKISNRHELWYRVVITLLIGLWMATTHRCNSEAGRADINLTVTNDTVMYFKNRLDRVTATANTFQFERDEMQKQFIIKDAEMRTLAKEFAKVHSATKFGSVTHIPEIAVRFDVPSRPCDSMYTFEKSGIVTEKWFGFKYKVTPDSLKLSNFSIPTETTVMTGIKRKWLLGKQTLTTDIVNTNPYITITTIRSAELIVTEPWYKKWYLWLAAGMAGGILLK